MSPMPSTSPRARVRTVESENDWRGPNPIPPSRLTILGSGLRKLFPKPAREALPASMQTLIRALQTKLDGVADVSSQR